MSRWSVLLVFVLMMTMTGCDPQLNLAGAYIPAWLACTVSALFVFWLCHLVFMKTGLLPYLKPLVVVYAALVVFLACLCWLLFFATR
jgi:hypothetical protein